MNVGLISLVTVAVPTGGALLGLILLAVPRFWRNTTRRGWEKLQSKVDQIVAEMDSVNSPKPSLQMCELLVAGEDHRFHHHPGVDPIALCRAVWKTIFYGQRQGGSTIAMQLVRTVTERYERTWRRKLLEMVLAIRLTSHIGHDRLPALYLWVAYYGWRMNGFRQACSRVRIDPHSASAFESAMLIARLKYPEPEIFSRTQQRRIQRRAAHMVSLRTH